MNFIAAHIESPTNDNNSGRKKCDITVSDNVVTIGDQMIGRTFKKDFSLDKVLYNTEDIVSSVPNGDTSRIVSLCSDSNAFTSKQILDICLGFLRRFIPDEANNNYSVAAGLVDDNKVHDFMSISTKSAPQFEMVPVKSYIEASDLIRVIIDGSRRIGESLFVFRVSGENEFHEWVIIPKVDKYIEGLAISNLPPCHKVLFAMKKLKTLTPQAFERNRKISAAFRLISDSFIDVPTMWVGHINETSELSANTMICKCLNFAKSAEGKSFLTKRGTEGEQDPQASRSKLFKEYVNQEDDKNDDDDADSVIARELEKLNTEEVKLEDFEVYDDESDEIYGSGDENDDAADFAAAEREAAEKAALEEEEEKLNQEENENLDHINAEEEEEEDLNEENKANNEEEEELNENKANNEEEEEELNENKANNEEEEFAAKNAVYEEEEEEDINDDLYNKEEEEEEEEEEETSEFIRRKYLEEEEYAERMRELRKRDQSKQKNNKGKDKKQDNTKEAKSKKKRFTEYSKIENETRFQEDLRQLRSLAAERKHRKNDATQKKQKKQEEEEKIPAFKYLKQINDEEATYEDLQKINEKLQADLEASNDFRENVQKQIISVRDELNESKMKANETTRLVNEMQELYRLHMQILNADNMGLTPQKSSDKQSEYIYDQTIRILNNEKKRLNEEIEILKGKVARMNSDDE